MSEGVLIVPKAGPLLPADDTQVTPYLFTISLIKSPILLQVFSFYL